MILIEHALKTEATPAQLWARYCNVPTWNEWDGEIENSSLNGPFVVGAKGRLKPKGGPNTSFTLTAVVPERHFSDVTHLPLARLIFRHAITPDVRGAVISHSIEMEGPLAFLFARLMGPKMRAGLPIAMETLGRLAAGELRALSV